MVVVYSIVACYGLVLGSFFNVLIYRIPLKKSIVRPASFCPECKTPIKPWHNIPILGYLLLRGKCRSCGRPIPFIYPFIELLTGCAAVAAWHFCVPSLESLTWHTAPLLITRILFLLLLIAISVIDLRHYIIPDVLTLPFTAMAAALSFIPGDITPLSMALGVLAGGGVLFAIGFAGSAILKKEAMGGGDIKLMAAAGALWGPQVALMGILSGAIFGSVYGIAAIIAKKTDATGHIPFGPFLAVGIWISVMFGDIILQSYMSFIGIAP